MLTYITEWVAGFDAGWDFAKFGDRPEHPIPTGAYCAGWIAGIDQFDAAMAELEELIRR